jgi:nitrile hydratase
MDVSPLASVVPALKELPAFAVGQRVRVLERAPIGHYRVPIYLRGHVGIVERVIEPAMIDNEEEGYGRNAGNRLHYYRVSFAMTEVWDDYDGSPRDELHIEIFETWLEQA